MEKKKFTFADAKKEIKELKEELGSAKKRLSKKDFYQGMAWGAAGAILLYVAAHIIF